MYEEGLGLIGKVEAAMQPGTSQAVQSPPMLLQDRPYFKASNLHPIQEATARQHLSPAELHLYQQGCFLPAYPLLQAHIQLLNDPAKTPAWILNSYAKCAILHVHEIHTHLDEHAGPFRTTMRVFDAPATDQQLLVAEGLGMASSKKEAMQAAAAAAAEVLLSSHQGFKAVAAAMAAGAAPTGCKRKQEQQLEEPPVRRQKQEDAAWTTAAAPGAPGPAAEAAAAGGGGGDGGAGAGSNSAPAAAAVGDSGREITTPAAGVGDGDSATTLEQQVVQALVCVYPHTRTGAQLAQAVGHGKSKVNVLLYKQLSDQGLVVRVGETQPPVWKATAAALAAALSGRGWVPSGEQAAAASAVVFGGSGGEDVWIKSREEHPLNPEAAAAGGAEGSAAAARASGGGSTLAGARGKGLSATAGWGAAADAAEEAAAAGGGGRQGEQQVALGAAVINVKKECCSSAPPAAATAPALNGTGTAPPAAAGGSLDVGGPSVQDNKPALYNDADLAASHPLSSDLLARLNGLLLPGAIPENMISVMHRVAEQLLNYKVEYIRVGQHGVDIRAYTHSLAVPGAQGVSRTAAAAAAATAGGAQPGLVCCASGRGMNRKESKRLAAAELLEELLGHHPNVAEQLCTKPRRKLAWFRVMAPFMMARASAAGAGFLSGPSPQPLEQQ